MMRNLKRSAILAVVAKAYDQYCPVAHALGLVGERWALLVVRELIHGPKRYTDLVGGIPGIGTNMLASRLRDLEHCGVVQKRKLPPPAASTVYELTEYGQELEEVMYALARWGARSLGPPGVDDELYPEWGVNALPALFDPEAARGVTATYVFAVGPDVFTACVESGHLTATVGETSDPDIRLETDMETFFRLATGELAPAQALERDDVRIAGDPAALERCFTIFTLAPRTSTRASVAEPAAA